jgi:hypothetical protein
MSFEQLDEILAMPVPPLPAEPEPVVDDDFLLRRFIGPEADHYIAIYNTALAKKPGKPFSVMWSWNWPAALFFLPWALHRKMWAFAGGVMLSTIVLAELFPKAGGFISLASAVACGMAGNVMYLRFVTNKIAKLKTISDSEEELLALISRVGGVTDAGAWYGAAVMVLAALVGFVAAFKQAAN